MASSAVPARRAIRFAAGGLAIVAGLAGLTACLRPPVIAVPEAPTSTTSEDSPVPAGPTTTCVWRTPTVEFAAAAAPTGKPPTTVPAAGYRVVTFDTNRGVITIELDLAKAPCTAASIAYLAGRGYYDGSACHRAVPQISALQCGDPTGTGSGGPAYQFADENLPTGSSPAYHTGDVAMANTGQPITNGGQFFFLWHDGGELQPNYSLFGHVLTGLEILQAVGAGGTDGAYESTAGGGHPLVPLTFTKVTVSTVTTSH